MLSPLHLFAMPFMGPRSLSDQTLLKWSSSAKLDVVGQPRVIIDNDRAFIAKIDAINGARSHIRLAYYIYSDDYSSSFLTQRLIAKAKAGVKVDLLVDYHTNYVRYDLFRMMEREGAGNLRVRFYNRPTKNIIRDVMYLTTPCPSSALSSKTDKDACYNAKMALIDPVFVNERIDGVAVADQNYSNRATLLSGLFLAGVYGKNPKAIYGALKISENIQISNQDLSENEKKQFNEFLKLLWEANAKRSFESRIKLLLAFSVHGDEIIPLYNQVVGSLPLNHLSEKKIIRDWEGFTDFLHHKVLIADQGQHTFVQLGGRNVEDSYHMRPNPMVSKYNFMDTDMSAVLRNGGGDLKNMYDALFNFTPMVARLSDVNLHAPADLVMNLDVALAALSECAGVAPSTGARFKACFDMHFNAKADSIEVRMKRQKRHMEKSANSFLRRYKPARSSSTWKVSTARYDDFLSLEDSKNMLLTYVENLPFDKSRDELSRLRTYSAEAGKEEKSGKYIQKLTLAGMENACRVSMENKKITEVLIHNAYYFPSSRLYETLARMVNGYWDCRFVRLRIITNSISTTDLNVVNFVARSQLRVLFNHYKVNRHTKAADLHYYEYITPPGGSKRSLHTKLLIMGDDVYLGSANADVRSYRKDSNNGFYLRNAKDFVAEYTRWIDGLIDEGKEIKEMSQYYMDLTEARIIEQNDKVVYSLLARWDKREKISVRNREIISATVNRLTKMVTDMATGVLDHSQILTDSVGNDVLDDQRQRSEQKKLGPRFDRMFEAI
jgi:phosphatidylserine/phosphatidylglycerophosphate/cardiolipin synthase-like enzyme